MSAKKRGRSSDRSPSRRHATDNRHGGEGGDSRRGRSPSGAVSRKPSRRSPPVGVSDANSTRVTGGDSGSSSRRDNSRSPSRQRHQDSRDSRSDKSLLPPEAFNKQRDRSPIGRQRSPHSNSGEGERRRKSYDRRSVSSERRASSTDLRGSGRDLKGRRSRSNDRWSHSQGERERRRSRTRSPPARRPSSSTDRSDHQRAPQPSTGDRGCNEASENDQRSSGVNDSERSAPPPPAARPKQKSRHPSSIVSDPVDDAVVIGATEDFSDFGDSDEEILKKDPVPEAEEEQRDDRESPIGKYEDGQLDQSALSANYQDQDQDLDPNQPSGGAESFEDDEKSKAKEKFADALGVDWSKLIELQKKQKEEQAKNKDAERLARKNYWTPVAIVNRLGLSKNLMGDKYDDMIRRVEASAKEGEKLELLHPVAGIHVTMRKMRERRKNLFKVGPFERAISAREDIAMRRELLGLPEEGYTPLSSSDIAAFISLNQENTAEMSK